MALIRLMKSQMRIRSNWIEKELRPEGKSLCDDGQTRYFGAAALLLTSITQVWLEFPAVSQRTNSRNIFNSSYCRLQSLVRSNNYLSMHKAFPKKGRVEDSQRNNEDILSGCSFEWNEPIFIEHIFHGSCCNLQRHQRQKKCISRSSGSWAIQKRWKIYWSFE